MAFGKRIKLFRTLRGMKQRQVGEILGFNGAATEVRMAQYESEAREPKAALIEQMASIFKVSPKAISVPEIDTYDGIMHTFFCIILQNNGNPENSIKTVSSGYRTP